MGTNSRALAFLFLAVVSAFVAVLLTREAVRGDSMPQVAAAPVLETQPVVVAAVDLAAGELIGPGQATVADWPKGMGISGNFADPLQVEQRVLTRPVQKGDVILEGVLAPVGMAAGLSALISEGKRAIAVKVDLVVGVAGFVSPGSRVDVLATMNRDPRSGRYTGVILQNLKVLAIDQRSQEAAAGTPQTASVVTLEVTQDEAQKLAHAATEGSLQLMLRNPRDETRGELPGVNGTDVIPGRPAPPRRSVPRKAPSNVIETIRGSEIGTSEVEN